MLVPASAVAFGLLTWSVAHIVTYALFARAPAAPNAFAHVPEGAAPPVVAVAFLVTTVAAAAVGAQRSPRASWLYRLQPGSVTAAFAPAAFVAVEACEYLVRGGEAPPAALLLIGVVVHAAMGAATPWLWSGFVRPAVLALLVEAVFPAPTAGGRSAAVVDADRPATRPPAPVAGRGPPRRRRHLRSLSCCA